MTQNEKDLLLKDLCCRLPYGVKVKISSMESPLTFLSINTNGETWVKGDKGYPFEIDWENCKPCLFPLSSMTEEQEKELEEIDPEFYSLIRENGDICISMDARGYDWLNKNNFDYRGLIPKGLAVDCTYLNIY